MTQKTPMAFMSYVHSDDKSGRLTTFRELLSDEVQMQTGIEFPIFQDRKDITWGKQWQKVIKESLEEVIFLIPIITPSFFNSKPCRDELTWFLERERKLGRQDLILPVYYVDTLLINDLELLNGDELAEVIAARQYAEWRHLRFEPFTNPEVQKTFAALASQIRDSLPRIHTNKNVPAEAAAKEAQQATAITDEGGEQRTTRPTTKKDPPTRTVDPMHRGDFATISEAIRKVDPGTRILVRPGVYEEGLLIDKPLEIIGDGNPGDIVVQVKGLDVILFQTTFGRAVNLTLRQLGDGKWFAVDIAQGRLELEDCDISSESLACVAIHDGADPKLRRCRIHHSIQGGVYVFDGGQGTLEDNDIFENLTAAVEIKTRGNPTIRRNRIHDGRGSGIYVYQNGQGTIEDNDIFGNTLSGVEIKRAGNPMLRRNRIHNGRVSGVYVHENGQGLLEDNDIFSNGYSGVSSRNGATPVVRNNRINNNASYGIRVYENGGGTFKSNDLTENIKGPWSIAEDSEARVIRANNKEN